MKNLMFIIRKSYVLTIFFLGLCKFQIVSADDFRKASNLPSCAKSSNTIALKDVANWSNCWGTYEYFLQNGERLLFDGEFVSGKMNGKGRIYLYKKDEILPAGLIYIGEFKDGNYHGIGTYTHKGDEVTFGKRVGQFKNGRFDGLGVEYAGDGSITSEGVWENDVLIKELKTEYSR